MKRKKQFKEKVIDWWEVNGFLVMVVSFIILAAAWQSSGLLVPENKAIKELEVQGYTDISISDRDWFCICLRGGASDDVVRFEAKAMNPAGKNVDVCVYSGWPFKGATIRSK